jgi:hypothetical protein
MITHKAILFNAWSLLFSSHFQNAKKCFCHFYRAEFKSMIWAKKRLFKNN